MDNSTPSTVQAITVSYLLDRYEAEVLPFTLAPQTQKNYRLIIPKLRALWGHRIVDELRPKDFGPWIYEVQKGRVQRVRMLAVLSSVFTWGVSRWYLIERNVLRDVKRFKNPPRDRLILDHEFDAMKGLSPPRMQLAMDLAVITGQRQGDILNFRWSDIEDLPAPVTDERTGDVVTQELNVYQSKTGKRIGIGITKDLEAVLDQCWQLEGRCEFILCRSMGGRYGGAGFRAMWQKYINLYCSRGGIRFTYHDIRALCATRQPTPEIAMRLLGHTNIAMTLKVYRRGKERVIPQRGLISARPVQLPLVA